MGLISIVSLEMIENVLVNSIDFNVHVIYDDYISLQLIQYTDEVACWLHA